MHDNLYEKAMDMARYAYKNVEAYRQLARDKGINIENDFSFEDLPLTDKNMYLTNADACIADEFLKNENKDKIIIRRTSGSTGKYLKIYWDYHDLMSADFPLWYARYKRYGITPRHRMCDAYTTMYIQNKFIENASNNGFENEFSFSKTQLSQANFDELYKSICEFDPEWMLLQPNIAVLLADMIEDRQLKPFPSVKYVEFTGELLRPEVRTRIEKLFNCKTADQYGCNEAGSIAYECSEKKLHINTANVYVEIIKDGVIQPEGEFGNIYITSLCNKAMPFVRYNIGDIGRIVSDKCSCGKKERVIEISGAREIDYVITDTNEKITSSLFSFPIEYINDKIGAIIRQYQIIQTGYTDFKVKMSITPTYFGWKDTIAEEFVAHLKDPYLKAANYEFEFSKSLLSEDNAGKHKAFIREVF